MLTKTLKWIQEMYPDLNESEVAQKIEELVKTDVHGEPLAAHQGLNFRQQPLVVGPETYKAMSEKHVALASNGIGIRWVVPEPTDEEKLKSINRWSEINEDTEYLPTSQINVGAFDPDASTLVKQEDLGEPFKSMKFTDPPEKDGWPIFYFKDAKELEEIKKRFEPIPEPIIRKHRENIRPTSQILEGAKPVGSSIKIVSAQDLPAGQSLDHKIMMVDDLEKDEPKFKPGDRVRVTEKLREDDTWESAHESIGKILEVFFIDYDDDTIQCGDDCYSWWIPSNCLELAD